MVRAYKPARIVEIGSGNSTKFFRKAISDANINSSLISIDPYPRATIESVVDQVIRKNFLDVPLEFFDMLTTGDILFLDGSHLVFHGSDVTHFFLRILPRLSPGVFVHLHDIWLPEEYPVSFDLRWYSEQYLLAAFLLGNEAWQTLVPVHFLYLKGLLPKSGGSFWMRKR